MGVYGDMSFNPSDEKPLSAYTNEEYLLEVAEEKNSQYVLFPR
mgnify:CR=1 FL=1